MNLPKFCATSVAGLLIAFPAAASDEQLKFLPFLGPRLEAARYSPANEEFAWVGWIGATVDLAAKGKWSAYFHPDVETILGHRIRSFEAVQANYFLEVGLSRDVGRGQISPFFHHVSRHVQDREKRQAVDWNFLGVRLDSPWPRIWNRQGGASVSVAVATLASAVEYNWEVRAQGDIDLVRRGSGAVFLLADLREVGAAPTTNFPRDHLTDIRVEFGLRRRQENSQFSLFAAYEHRSDALIPKALVTDRALFGFRMSGERRSPAATVPRP